MEETKEDTQNIQNQVIRKNCVLTISELREVWDKKPKEVLFDNCNMGVSTIQKSLKPGEKLSIEKLEIINTKTPEVELTAILTELCRNSPKMIEWKIQTEDKYLKLLPLWMVDITGLPLPTNENEAGAISNKVREIMPNFKKGSLKHFKATHVYHERETTSGEQVFEPFPKTT